MGTGGVQGVDVARRARKTRVCADGGGLRGMREVEGGMSGKERKGETQSLSLLWESEKRLNGGSREVEGGRCCRRMGGTGTKYRDQSRVWPELNVTSELGFRPRRLACAFLFDAESATFAEGIRQGGGGKDARGRDATDSQFLYERRASGIHPLR